MMKVQVANPDNVGFADCLNYPNEQKIANSGALSSPVPAKTPSTRRSFFKPAATFKKDAVASPSPSKQTVTTTVVEPLSSERPKITVTKPAPKPGFIIKTVRKSKTRIVNGQKVTEVTTTYIEEPINVTPALTTKMVKKMPPRSTSSSPNSKPTSPTAHPTKKNHGWGRKILKTFGKKKKGGVTKMPMTPLEAVPETVEQEEDSNLPHSVETTTTTSPPVSIKNDQPARDDITTPKEAAPSLPSMFSSSLPSKTSTTSRAALDNKSSVMVAPVAQPTAENQAETKTASTTSHTLPITEPHIETTAATSPSVSNQKQQPPKKSAPSVPSMFAASFPTRTASTAKVAPKALALPSHVPTKLPVAPTSKPTPDTFQNATATNPVPPTVRSPAPAPVPAPAQSNMVSVPVLGSPVPRAAVPAPRPVLGAPVSAPAPVFAPDPVALGAVIAPVPAPTPVHAPTPLQAPMSVPVVQLPVPVPDNDVTEYDEDEYEEVVTYYVEEDEDYCDDGESEYEEITVMDDAMYDVVYYEEETVLDDSQHSNRSMQQHFAARPGKGPAAAAPIKMEGMELLMANIRAKVPAVQ